MTISCNILSPWAQLVSRMLSPVETDATLLANNYQHCWVLHVASVCTPCCMLLDVAGQRLKPVKLFSQQLPRFLLFRDRWSAAQQCWTLPTLLGPRTPSTHGLQRLVGCILPTMHCRPQHCTERYLLPSALTFQLFIGLHLRQSDWKSPTAMMWAGTWRNVQRPILSLEKQVGVQNSLL